MSERLLGHKIEVYPAASMKAVKRTSNCVNNENSNNNNNNLSNGKDKNCSQKEKKDKKLTNGNLPKPSTSTTTTTTNNIIDQNGNIDEPSIKTSQIIKNSNKKLSKMSQIVNGTSNSTNNNNDSNSNDNSTNVNGSSSVNQITSIDFDVENIYDLMKSERLRLLSFNQDIAAKWPHENISCEQLAKAGFFYLCTHDKVKCPFCLVELQDWAPTDIPLLEHMKHSMNCPFLLDYNVGNIPINGVNPVNGFMYEQGHDVCGYHNIEIQINGSPSSGSISSQSSLSPTSLTPLSASPSPSSDSIPIFYAPKYNLNELGVRPHYGAKNPDYISVDKRLKSFENKWNLNLKATPEKLAQAGFYNVGIGDYVKCFYCDGGLCEWDPEDDPWTEHASWFPDCDFVILNKGAAFVESCQEANRKRKLNHQLTNSSLTDDQKSINAVNQWLKSDLVKQLLNHQRFDEDIIKAALHQRWLEKQEPFEHLCDLMSAIVQLKSIPRLISINLNEDEINDKESSKDTDSNFSSMSTTPSACSPRGERLFCKICLDKEVGVLFLPCGHVVACTQCAPGLQSCPICRKSIKGIVRTYFS